MEPHRVLVVDDDPTIREMLEMILESEGFEVMLESNGAGALSRLAAERPDVILLDMKMSVMDGWEFIERYRAQPNPTVPIIVFTAAHDAASRAASVGVQGYLAKPFAIDDLIRTLQEATRLA